MSMEPYPYDTMKQFYYPRVEDNQRYIFPYTYTEVSYTQKKFAKGTVTCRTNRNKKRIIK